MSCKEDIYSNDFFLKSLPEEINRFKRELDKFMDDRFTII